jgi:hypothetical protein
MLLYLPEFQCFCKSKRGDKTNKDFPISIIQIENYEKRTDKLLAFEYVPPLPPAGDRAFGSLLLCSAPKGNIL